MQVANSLAHIEFPKLKVVPSDAIACCSLPFGLLPHVESTCRLLSCGRLRCIARHYSGSKRHSHAAGSTRMTFDWCELSDQMGFRMCLYAELYATVSLDAARAYTLV